MARPLAVMFLGAGFSRKFGLPLTAELWDYGLKRHPEAVKRLPSEPIEKSEAIKACIESGDKDVEHLLDRMTQVIDEKWGIENFNDCGQAALVYFISNVCMHLESISHDLKADHKPLFDSLTLALHRSRTHQDLAFVTTNYDLCIEVLLRRATGDVECSYTKLDGPFVPVRKLHGSVNWTAVPTTMILENFECIGRVERSYLYQDDYKVYDIKLSPFNWPTGIIPPVLIPPHPDKSYREIFDRQRQDAASLLKRAKRILFVGYSFPKADNILSEWLTETMKESKAEVTCINPDAESLKRAESIFQGLKLRVKSKKWELDDFSDFLESERRNAALPLLDL